MEPSMRICRYLNPLFPLVLATLAAGCGQQVPSGTSKGSSISGNPPPGPVAQQADEAPDVRFPAPEDVYLMIKSASVAGDYEAVFDGMMPEAQDKTVGAIVLAAKFQRDYVRENPRGAYTEMLQARHQQSALVFEKYGITDDRLKELGTGDRLAYAKNRLAIMKDARVHNAAELLSDKRAFFKEWHELDDTPSTLHVFTMVFGHELTGVEIYNDHAKAVAGGHRLSFEKTSAGWLVKSY